MKNLNPYLRYARQTSHLPNKDFVKAYDCRFLFILSGEGKFITKSIAYDLSENSLVYYPSGVEYHIKSNEDSLLNFVTINFDFTNSFVEINHTLPPVKPCGYDNEKERPTYLELDNKEFSKVFVLKNAYFLREDLITLSEIFRENKNYTKELCHALVRCVILKIAIRLSAPQKINKVVLQTLNFIENNYSKDINVKTVADKLGYHPYYLSALFKSHYNKTLSEYLLEKRLKHSQELLLHTDKSISEIALCVGFFNADHFSARFKKMYGLSPLRWRKENNII